MSRVASRTFCCCIPVRAGVILISLLGMGGGGVIAVGGILNVKHAHGSKAAAIAQIVIYLILAIISLFGFIGAITRRLGFIRAYLSMLIVHMLLSLGLGIFAIIRNFKDAPKYYADCIKGPDGVPSQQASVINTCTNGTTLLKSLMIAIFVVIWLLETWACFIVGNYTKQLAEEDRENLVKDTESW